MILKPARIVTGDGATVLKEHGILVRDGIIRSVKPMETLLIENTEEDLVDLAGCTLLPGLVDMHVHLGSWNRTRPFFSYINNDFTQAYVALDNARDAFRWGVTTLRDVCTANRLTVSMLWARENGFLPLPLPRIIPCGNGICMTGGHGSEIPYGGEEVDGPWELRRVIRRNIKEGAQWIKILTSCRTSTPEFTQEELDAAADEAHRLGRRIAAHSGKQPSIQMCIDAGIDSIEHGTDMTVEQACQMKEKNISWTPTIIAYTQGYELKRAALGPNATESQRYEAEKFGDAARTYRDHFKALYDTGVLVTAGTDQSVDEGQGMRVARELRYMVDYGISPLEAIRVGTHNGALALHLDGETGLISEGLCADLLVVKGDPTKDIRALEDVRRVYLAGKEVYRVDH